MRGGKKDFWRKQQKTLNSHKRRSNRNTTTYFQAPVQNDTTTVPMQSSKSKKTVKKIFLGKGWVFNCQAF